MNTMTNPAIMTVKSQSTFMGYALRFLEGKKHQGVEQIQDEWIQSGNTPAKVEERFDLLTSSKYSLPMTV